MDRQLRVLMNCGCQSLLMQSRATSYYVPRMKDVNKLVRQEADDLQELVRQVGDT